MGVRTLLTAYQNRSDGPKFEVWEEANGKVQAYQNGSPLVAAETNPLTGGIGILVDGEDVSTKLGDRILSPGRTQEWTRLFGPNELVAWNKGAEITSALSLTNSIFRREGASLPLLSDSFSQTYSNINKTGLNLDLSSAGVIGVLFYIERPNSNTYVRMYMGTSYNDCKLVSFDVASGQVAEGWNFMTIHTAEDGSTTFPYKTTGFGWRARVAGVNINNTDGALADPNAGHNFANPVTFVRIELAGMLGINRPNVFLEGVYAGGREKPKLTIGFDIITSNLEQYIMPMMQERGLRGYIAAATGNGNPATPQYLITRALETTIRTLLTRGWDVLPHSVSHNSLGSMTDSQRIVSEYMQSREALSILGCASRSQFFATPNGSWSNRTAYELARAGCMCQRQTMARLTPTSLVGVVNPFNLGALGGAGAAATLQRHYDYIAAMIRYGQCGHYYTHGVVEGGDGTNNPADGINSYVYTFERFLNRVAEEVAAGNLEVVTPSEWMHQVHVPDLCTAVAARQRATITPGESPWTFVNTGYVPLRVELVGGTVSQVEYSNDGSTFDVTTGPQVIPPGDMLKITYSAAPTVVLRRT